MMAEEAERILLQGNAETWNNWRSNNGGELTFSRPNWYDSPGPGGIQIKGQNQVNFSNMNLSGLSVYNAFAEGVQARKATIHQFQ